MLEDPLVKFAVGALLGVIASFSISLGLVSLFFAVALVVLFAMAWRSRAALAGGMGGWGLTWLVIGGTTYASCLGRGPDCVPSEATVPFLAVAAVIVLTGAAIGLLAIARDRAKRRRLRA